MSAPFRFRGFELDVDGFVLRRSAERIKLERIPMELLILLVQNAGALVGRSQLQALWGPEIYVEHDSSINTAIRKIRQALGDKAERPRFIETVVGKGYRFVGRIEGRAAVHNQPRYCLTRGKQEFLLNAGENIIGRDADVQVHVDHPAVSRRHARILVEQGRAAVEDLGSLHGTFVNGHRADAMTDLTSSSIIGLGPITLTFLLLPVAASTAPVSGGFPHRTGDPP